MSEHRRLPPASPFGLIQESTWPNRWLTLVACMLLNCTSRKQVEKIFPEFRKRWPTATAFAIANPEDVRTLIKPLGFKDRRTINLFKMTADYLTPGWRSVRELHGIGEYAAQSDELFFEGKIGDDPPNDHALVKYHAWLKRNKSSIMNDTQ